MSCVEPTKGYGRLRCEVDSHPHRVGLITVVCKRKLGSTRVLQVPSLPQVLNSNTPFSITDGKVEINQNSITKFHRWTENTVCT